MRVLYIVYVLLLIPSLLWAGGLELSGTDKLQKADKALAVKAWPKVKRALPGLDDYVKDIQLVSVEKSTSGDGLTFQFKVSERPSVIPVAFKAQGNYCYIDVDRRLKTATVSKRACISVATQINAFDPTLSASMKGGPLVIDLD